MSGSTYLLSIYYLCLLVSLFCYGRDVFSFSAKMGPQLFTSHNYIDTTCIPFKLLSKVRKLSLGNSDSVFTSISSFGQC